MAYQPVISLDHIAPRMNQFAASPAIDDMLRRCFDSEILPSRTTYPRRFLKQDIFSNLYTSERAWVDPVNFQPEAPERHELYLHELFWERELEKPIICITGNVGSGKSTLVDYYLRCYCPSDPAHRSDFDRKLVIHFDATDVQDNTDFYHLFFLHIQASVRAQCEHSGFNIDNSIQKRATQPNNVREWVWAAFEELSSTAFRRSTASPFSYIALVVDNLDQTPTRVQIRAVTEVEQWLRNPLIRLWRVFLPLWPTTFHSLRNHRFNLLRGATQVSLGPLDVNSMFAHRERAVDDFVNSSTSSAVRASAEYFSEITQFASRRLVDRVTGLSNGSLRLVLSLWGGFIRSEAAFAIHRQRRANADSQRSFDYELLDGLIVGSFEAMNQRTHRIINLFAVGRAHESPRDVLLGPHVMFLMEKGFHHQRTLVDALSRLGYTLDSIEDAVDSFSAFNILHQVPTQNFLSEYEIHGTVVSEYVGNEETGYPRRGLIWEPAYADNVAMVTPVKLETLRQMKKSRGDRAEDFTNRVETTIAFLRFLRTCEDTFRDTSHLGAMTGKDEFRESLSQRKLPCLWRGMSLNYRDRLIGLSGSGYLKMIDQRWWTWVLDDSIFRDCRVTSPTLEHL